MTRCSLLLCAGLASLTFLAVQRASAQAAPVPGAPSQAVRQLVDKGQYADALKLAEEGLKAAPADPSLRMCQVEALLGLHRTMEARQVALSSATLGPGFRFMAGVCTAKFGRLTEAVEMWKPLYGDKDWAGPAYRESVVALEALGKEAEAKALLAEALQKVPGPPASLLSLSLDLDKGLASGKATLEKLKAVDPANASKYDALSKVYAAADGDLFQESLAGKLPAEITLKEKSERVEPTSLTWGGGVGGGMAGPGGGGGASVHSSTQGYGAGTQDNSAREGGKTATMSSPPRVVVEAKINGERSEPFALDSASSQVLITAKMAKKLNLQRLAPGEYGGVGLSEPVASEWVLLKDMNVGPLHFKNVPALVIGEKTEYWKETGGVIPLWMFRHYGLHYDRRHGELTLYPSGTSPAQVLGAGAFPMKVLWFSGMPFAETRIQDKPVCYVLLATVNVGTYIEARRVADLGISLKTGQYGSQRERGLFNLIASGVADNVALNLGPTRINLPTVLVADLCPDREVDCVGLVGRNVLDLFDVYLDYPANALALKGYEKGR